MEFNKYQYEAFETTIYPVQYSILYPTLGLCGESGEIAEKIKKVIRDEGGIDNMLEDTRQLLKKELGDVLWYLANLSLDLGFTLDEVANANLEKLASRKERGLLSGSGDNR